MGPVAWWALTAGFAYGSAVGVRTVLDSRLDPFRAALTILLCAVAGAIFAVAAFLLLFFLLRIGRRFLPGLIRGRERGLATGGIVSLVIFFSLWHQKWIGALSFKENAVAALPLSLILGLLLGPAGWWVWDRFTRVGRLLSFVAVAAVTGCFGGVCALAGGGGEAPAGKEEVSGLVVARESERIPRLLEHPPPVVAIVGLDGADWSVLDPLLEGGRLPNLSRLVEHAATARLASMQPNYSPVIWSTIWTGKRPEEHGIHHFLRHAGMEIPGFPGPIRLANLPPIRFLLGLVFEETNSPVTTYDRRARTIWNIVNEVGIPVGLVNLLTSWPAEHVLGYELSGHVKFYPDLEELTWPPELLGSTLEALDREWSVEGVPGLDATPWIKKRYRRETNLVRYSLELQAEAPVWVYVFYTHCIDSAQHRYWKYHAPTDFPFRVDPEDLAVFGDVIRETYLLYDRLLGELMDAFPEETTWIVISDHGVAPNRRITEDVPAERGLEERPPADPRNISGTHSAEDEGILILSGPEILPGAIDSASVYDIAPTALAILGLPVPEDMSGRVLRECLRPRFLAEVPIIPCRTYEGAPVGSDSVITTHHDEDWKERLRALGYIE
jgi:predicted AlkP superfamily phosphohydrolase/phosphomutase